MDFVKDALIGMVRAGRELDELRQSYSRIGLKDDSLFEISGFIDDAVYALVRESAGVESDFDDSIVSATMHDLSLSDDQRVEILMNEYQKNCVQPGPMTIEPKEMRRMVRRYGGYYHDSQ